MEELIKTSVLLTIIGTLLSFGIHAESEGLKIRKEFIKTQLPALVLKNGYSARDSKEL